ncbi:MAG: GNAT family N-acetyltransferase [Candidatus Eremiobacteraeota bacterium]|nr:GNAT family N-acetyltransferase [Candidatus Eremiobacteraeota bacterium]MBC5826448.1 GNAT family N-acetyltransferase [Candidatus Eremiobacteraeota bacterium]
MAPVSLTGVREVRDADSARILEILAAAFAEYPGCVLELREVPELLRPATSASAHGVRFWVATRERLVVGFASVAPTAEPGLLELKKLYAHPDVHGTGVGRVLLSLVERDAAAHDARRIHLWTDTRFTKAHRVYERRGYVRLPETRELHDVSRSVEYHYQKEL